MRVRFKSAFAILILSVAIFLVQGCQPSGQNDGIHIMFEKTPHIVTDEVYWHGQPIGTISDTQVGPYDVTRVTLRLDPQFRKQAGHHWAFYAQGGRLVADRLATSGDTVDPGDHVCGFASKAALNWFKIKTLLNNRVATAKRRADNLSRRFG